MIIHITNKERWQEAKRNGYYVPESLREEGYIPCARPSQLIEVIARIFQGREDLLMVCIDEERVEAEIKYEDLYDSGEKYPHIYGKLNLNAVLEVCNFVADEDKHIMKWDKMLD